MKPKNRAISRMPTGLLIVRATHCAQRFLREAAPASWDRQVGDRHHGQTHNLMRHAGLASAQAAAALFNASREECPLSTPCIYSECYGLSSGVFVLIVGRASEAAGHLLKTPPAFFLFWFQCAPAVLWDRLKGLASLTTVAPGEAVSGSDAGLTAIGTSTAVSPGTAFSEATPRAEK